MKKKSFLLLALLLACLLASAALADDYGNAVVYARNGGGVHLREEATTQSDSMGLFFTGVEVNMRTNPNNSKWVRVHIEGMSGYMHSDYLRWGSAADNVSSLFGSGEIDVKNYVNFRRGPSTEYKILGRINDGERVTIMGETKNHWYFIHYNGTNGFVSGNMVDSVQLPSSAQLLPNIPQHISPYLPGMGMDTQPGRFPANMPLEWTHSSGAGAWRTELSLDSEGGFVGEFSDQEGSIVYHCAFEGRFTDIRRVDDYRYVMTLSKLDIHGTVGEAVARNGILYITQEPAGLEEGHQFVIYMPNVPLRELLPEERTWLQQRNTEKLETYFLCNRDLGRGFMPDTEGW